MRKPVNAVLGSTIVAVFVLVAIGGHIWTPYNPLGLNLLARFHAPDAAHWLGTDAFGRDVLSRLMAGAGTSLLVSVLTVALALIAGVVLGSLSGYFGGWLDRIIMALIDAMMAFPGILLALGLLTVLGAGFTGIVLALGIAYTPAVTRVLRGTVLTLRSLDYINASRMSGNGEIYTLARHVLPNCLAPLTVLVTSMLGWVILAESALSFLGMGVPPPAPTWGNMLADALGVIDQAPWLGIFPGLCLSITLLGINLLGDALRDWLDPKMRG